MNASMSATQNKKDSRSLARSSLEGLVTTPRYKTSPASLESHKKGSLGSLFTFTTALQPAFK